MDCRKSAGNKQRIRKIYKRACGKTQDLETILKIQKDLKI